MADTKSMFSLNGAYAKFHQGTLHLLISLTVYDYYQTIKGTVSAYNNIKFVSKIIDTILIKQLMT
jgi:hypothetical protein